MFSKPPFAYHEQRIAPFLQVHIHKTTNYTKRKPTATVCCHLYHTRAAGARNIIRHRNPDLLPEFPAYLTGKVRTHSINNFFAHIKSHMISSDFVILYLLMLNILCLSPNLSPYYLFVVRRSFLRFCADNDEPCLILDVISIIYCYSISHKYQREYNGYIITFIIFQVHI